MKILKDKFCVKEEKKMKSLSEGKFAEMEKILKLRGKFVKMKIKSLKMKIKSLKMNEKI